MGRGSILLSDKLPGADSQKACSFLHFVTMGIDETFPSVQMEGLNWSKMSRGQFGLLLLRHEEGSGVADRRILHPNASLCCRRRDSYPPDHRDTEQSAQCPYESITYNQYSP